ncbi:TetR/AcrR family transcriptional regulator [Paenarthrobacter sp. NPDC057981]|uniref:TetR/AcrR family transcriptional regulator n=1 Tax=Paenarthrobacter sp. NPDC057981 TaxID=3346297 RepID=UPI0036DE158A
MKSSDWAPTSPKGRGRPRDPKLREAVLKTAARQLYDTGFDRITLEGLAAEAGVGKPTIYRWWPNKAAVITDALLSGFLASPQIELDEQANGTWDGIERWLRILAERISGPYGELMRATTAIIATDAVLGEEILVAYSEPARQVLLSYLRRGIAKGDVQPGAALEPIVDIAWAMIVFIGTTRANPERIPAIVEILRRAAGTDECT